MPRKAKRAAIKLPDHVFPVTSRGKTYYYFERGRGGKSPGPRHRIEGDPYSPQFWIKYRELMGDDYALPALTVSEAIDRMLMELRAKGTVKPQSILFYDQSSRIARKAWGDLSPSGLRPKHVETVFDSMRSKTGAANNFLSFMRAFGKWMRKNDLTMFQLTEGLSAHEAKDGHRPWTAEQLATAEAKLTGAVRRGFFLYRYTGLRGSDVVRLGPEHVVDGGFEIVTQKREVPIFCPILPELAAEMANWEAGEGPFLRQQGGRADGRPYTRKLFSKHFAAQRDTIAGLSSLTLHGLRATAVGRLRAGGVEILQICDIVGMSPAMVQRYSKYLDRRASAKAGMARMLETEAKAVSAKHSENAKQKQSKTNKIGDAR